MKQKSVIMWFLQTARFGSTSTTSTMTPSPSLTQRPSVLNVGFALMAHSDVSNTDYPTKNASDQQFDISGDLVPDVPTFGFGRRMCVGQPLAR